MKTSLSCILRNALSTVFFLLLSTGAFANHIVGMDFNYQYVSGSTYQITLVAYGDCGELTAFPYLSSSTPTICIYDGATYITTFNLSIVSPSTGVFTSPVCAADTNLTTCTNTSYTIPGIKKFTYTNTYTVPYASHNWRFVFNGVMGSSSFAGRQTSITNITGAGTSVICLIDTLDNTWHNNTSPALNTPPTPYYCNNNPSNYTPNAVDPDGDSLHFFLTDGKIAPYPTASCSLTGTTTPYTGTAWGAVPISATTPLQVTAGSWGFNSYNGTITFNPNALQRGLVVYSIQEYRNDTFIGTSQREMVFVVQTCTTLPPAGIISSPAGAGILVDSVDYLICQGSGAYSFHILPTEPDTSKKISVTVSGLPSGSSFTVSSDSTNHPNATFSWSSTGVTAGTYTFYVTLRDDNCPIRGSNTIAYHVTITGTPTLSGIATVCAGATTTFSAVPVGGTWSSGSTGIATVGSSSGIVTGVAAGTSVISYAIGSGTCIATRTVTVVAAPSPITGTPNVCIGFTRTLTDATSGGVWTSNHTAIATVGSSTGIVTGITAGVDTIYYTQAGCSSMMSFTVNPNPAAITGVMTVCTGQTTTLSDASGGGVWTSSNTSIGTVGVLTGVVYGVSSGVVTISYTVGSCYAVASVTVNTSPAAITGPSSVCVGFTISLSDATGGGVWSSSNPGVATIGSASGLVTGIGSGTTIISYTIAGCSVTKTITVYPIPSGITGLTAVCIGQTTALSVTGSGAWSSSNTGIATVGSSSGIVTGISAGTAIITFTASTGCYTIFPITVYPLPGPITGSAIVCVGQTTTESDTSAGGFWSSSDVTIADIDAGSGTVTGISTGVVTLSYTIGTGCTATRSFTVNSSPGIITGIMTVCVGSTTPLFDVGGGTWSSSTPSVATVGSITGIVTGVSGYALDIITYTIPSGCYVTTIITVNPLPATIIGTFSICIGQTTTLSDATPGGSWSSSNPGVASIVATTGLMTGITSGTTTISYTLPSGCFTTVVVTVNTGTAPITGPASICIGACATYSDAVGGGTWSSSAPAIGTIGSLTGILCGISSGITTITYSLGAGCYSTKSVTVNPLPGAIGGPAIVCVGATITLTDGSPGGTWTSSNNTVATIGSNTGIVTGIATGTCTITYTLATGCIRTTTITVNPTPALFLVTGGGSFCAGGAGVHIGLSGSVIGVNYQLFLGGTPLGAAVAGTGSALDFGLFTTAGTYSVSGTIPATGCNHAMSGSITIVVNPLPPLCNVTGGGSYCVGGPGDHVGLSCSSPGISYQLLLGGSPVGLPLAGTGGPLDFGYQTAAGIYTVMATNTTTGCQRLMTGSATIVINPLPLPIGGPSALCVGATIALTDPGGGTWLSGTPSVATIGATTGVVTGITTGTTVITYTLPTGCPTTKTITVSLSPGPILGPAGVCVGASVTLTDTVPGGIWTSSLVSIATIGSLSGIATGVATGTTIITYSLGSGCTVTRTLSVNAAPAAISGPSSVCVGSTISLSDATFGGLWGSYYTSVATVSGTGVVTGISPGIDTISYSVSGCAAIKSITVNPTPALISGPSTVCMGTTITLTDAVPGGTWSSGGAAISIGSASGIVSGISAGTGIVTYSIGTCITTKPITVNSTAPVTGTLGICVGSTTSLSDATAGGTWSSSTPSVATINSTSGLVTGIIPGTTIITYTIPGGCSVNATMTVYSTPTPIGGTLAVCVGSSTTLTDGAGGGAWTSASTGIAIIGSSSGLLTGITPGTSLITYSLGGICTVTATITVNPVPGPITGTAHVCTGSSISLSDGTPGGTWGSTNTLVAIVGSSTGLVSGLSSGTTVISYTLSTGCAATVVFTVNPIPALIFGSPLVCVGQTATLGDPTPGGIWTSSATAIATVGSGTGIVTGITPGTALITYSIGGCVAVTTATVVPAPSPILGITNVCVGYTTTLSDTVAGGTWSCSIPAIATVGSLSGIVTGVSSGTVIITYTLGSTGCMKVIPLIVNPIAPILGTPFVCVGQTTTLTDTALGGLWSSSATGIATVNAAGIVTGVSAGVAVISYYLPTGCTATISLTVNPLPLPIVGPSSVCVGQSIVLSDPSVGVSGTWSSSNPGVGSIDVSGIVTGVSSGFTTISYTFSGTTGCAATRLITVNPVPAPISGPNDVCLGFTITLTDAGSGTWSSSNPAIGSVGSATGIVMGLAIGTVTIDYTLGTGCFASKLVNVINPPSAIVGTFAICLGSTTVLTDPPGTGAWSSSNISVAAIGSSTGMLTGISSGISIITYSTGAGCIAIQTITVNTLPGAIMGATNLCVGSTSTLTSFGAGTWTSSDSTVATIGHSTGVVTPVAPGVTIITFTLSTGCSATVLLTVGATPSPITGVNAVCIGGTTTLFDATSGGVWTSSASGIAPVSPTGVVTGSSVGTATISYTVPGFTCPATTIVTVNPLPTAITGSTNLCEGSATLLTDGVTGGTWTSSDITVATAGSASGVVTGVSAGLVTITYTLGAGCFAFLDLTVNPLPSAISGPTTVCQGQSVTLFDATAGGTWSSTTPAIGTVNATGDVTGIAAGIATISYANGFGCAATYLVTVNTSPSPISGSLNVCLAGTSVLHDLIPGGTWSSVNPGVATIGSSSGIVTGISLGTTTIIYMMPGGCFVTANVTVYSLPTVFTVTGGGSHCAGDIGVHIGLTGSAIGVNYLLYNGATAVGTFPGTGGAMDFGLLTVAGTYTVRGTSTATGCTVNMAGSALVTVLPSVLPSVGMTISPNDTVCAGSTVTFTAIPVNGGSSPIFRWSINSFPVALTSSYSFIPANGDVVKVTLTSNATCALPSVVSDSVIMTVLPFVNPAVSVFANPDDTVCKGTAVTLNAIPAYGGTAPYYSWQKNGAPVGIGVSYTFVPNNGDVVFCMMNSNYPCRLANADTSLPVVMTVINPVLPLVTITAHPGTIIGRGQPDTLTATVTGATAPTYQWYVNGIPIPGATNATYTSSSFGYPKDDSVSCMVTSHDVCIISAHQWVYITVNAVDVKQVLAGSDINVIPNPNKGDFMVSGTLKSLMDEDISVEITDMLGQVVYRNKFAAKNGKLNERIQFNNIPANGMYVLSLRSGTENKVFHIVIEQ